jgi:moderate conductance mechanosensitive channel
MNSVSSTQPGELGQTIHVVRERIMSYITNPEVWANLSISLIYIVIILLASRIVLRVVNQAFEHMMTAREKSRLKIDARRTKTIGRLMNNIVTYTVNFLTILLILSQIGLKLGPLLAGAGVVGLAIGFGAQSLVKDVITGFFIIFEDQFGVGDVIQTNNVKGTVEEIGLRITRIRSWTGEVYVIPNGSITQVTNFSVNNSVAVMDVSIAYEADIDAATKVIKSTALEIYQASELIVKEPEVLGIQTLGASEITIRVIAECKPNTNQRVVREMNAKLKKALDEQGMGKGLKSLSPN